MFSLHFLKAILNDISFLGAVCNCWGSLLSLSWLLLFSARFSVSHPSMLRLLCAAWPSKLKYITEGLRLSCALLLIRCLRTPQSKISFAHLGCWDFCEVWLGKMCKVQTWFKKRNKNYPFCEPWHLPSKPLTLYKDLWWLMNCLRALCASVGSFVWKSVTCSVFNFIQQLDFLCRYLRKGHVRLWGSN